ncbi:MAG: hypothetical protein JXR83_20665 [Deltaproteobacteria bacterium]|nr:hypothetical protein [Deltaproteobacteria bacterium]
MIAVHQVTVASKWARAYRQLARELYAADPGAPPAVSGRSDAATDDRHPFFGYGRGRRFIAVDGTRPVARVAAYLNPTARDRLGAAVGFVGHFEAQRDAAAARLALDAACAWLADQGVAKVVGPVDFSIWHRYRLVSGGSDGAPFFLEPHNRPYYHELFEAGGFVPEHHYVSHRVVDPVAIVEKGRAAGERLRRAGYSLRPFDRRRFDAELRLLHQLSGRTFVDNAYYTACPYEEFCDLCAGLRQALPAGFAWFAHAPDGLAAGFVLGLPDLAGPLRAMRGRSGLNGAARFWWARRRVDTNIARALGVVPEHRLGGLGSWLLGAQQEQALRRGLTRTIHAPTIADQPARRLAPGGAQPLRSYTLYCRGGAGAD